MFNFIISWGLAICVIVVSILAVWDTNLANNDLKFRMAQQQLEIKTKGAQIEKYELENEYYDIDNKLYRYDQSIYINECFLPLKRIINLDELHSYQAKGYK